MADVATVAELFADKYDVVEKLEWNGLALVYKAKRKTGEPLAVAMLPIDTQSSPDAVQIFKGKATELQLLVEPGIVRVTGHGIQHGVPYLELEYTDATTLADELLDGPLDRDQAFALTSELLDILGRAHAGGHFHWDLTPSNILLSPGMDGSEHVSIIGFGIQQIIRATFDPEKTGPTGRGSGPKAKRYLAPELQDARNPDARADVFGVAAVIHHMLTGSPPGPGSPAPPADLAEALAQAMAPDPNARPADAATLGFTLAEGASGGAGETPSFAPPAAAMPAPFAPAPLPAVESPPVAADEPALPEPPPFEMDEPELPEPPPPVIDQPAFPEPAEAIPEPPAPLDVPLDEGPLPSVTEAGDFPAEATVVDARALTEEDFLAPPTGGGAVTSPVPDFADLAPVPEAAEYESLGPPVSAGAAAASDELDMLLGGPGPSPEPTPPPAPAPAPPSDADVVMSPAPAPRPATSQPAPSGDPFAPASYAPGPITKNPYEAEEFAQQEKKTGSMIAAIIVLTIAIGLAVTFFMIRATG